MSVSRRTWVLLAVACALVCYGWFDVRRRARVDRGTRFHRTDFTVYQYAARAMANGSDPYEARNPRGYRYVYPPFFAALLVPLADWDPPNAALLFYGVSMAGLLLALWLLCRVPHATGPPLGRRAVLVALVLCVGFLHQSFQRGQVTILLLALHTLALVAIGHRRWFTCALLLTLAGSIRLTPFLSAGALGIGLCVAARHAGWGRVVRFAAGGVVGLLVAFVAIPVIAVGADTAQDATASWWASTRKVYGGGAGQTDLLRDYKINEYRFKNQAPRRVFSTWAGWATQATFVKERPTLTDGARRTAHGAAWALAALAALLGVWWTVRALRNDEPAVWVAATAWTGLLPVLITRYTWPTHFVMALPVLAMIAAGGRRRDSTALAIFLLGAGAFYVGHAKVLQPVGAIGPLMLATMALLWLQRRSAEAR